ncbi:hypothetical protein TKK_0018134 [Trichogramma kaykai]
MSTKPRFLAPGDNIWQEDKADIDAHVSTQFVYNANNSLSLDVQRKRLPIFKVKNHILYLLEKYQTLVLVGETGCGKSTQVPQVIQLSSNKKAIHMSSPKKFSKEKLRH